jgi:hypothetical protein
LRFLFILALVGELAFAETQSSASNKLSMEELHREGVRLAQEGDLEGAIKHFKSVLDIKPTSAAVSLVGN